MPEPIAPPGQAAAAQTQALANLPPPPQQPAAPSPPPVRQASVRLEQVTSVAAVAMQLTLWGHSAASLDRWQHMRQGMSVALQLVCVAIAFYLPRCRSYRKLRVPLISVARILLAAVPNNRATGEGLALLLDRPASPGLMGALHDYLRVASGTRVLALVLAVVVVQQPPLAVLLQQCAVMALTANNSAYCSSQILSDPLTQRRLAWLWAALEFAPIFIPPQAAAAAGALGGPADKRHLCTSLINMHQLVCGILLPTLLAARCNCAHHCSCGRPQRRWQQGELLADQQPHRPQQAQQRSMSEQQQQQGPPMWARLWASLDAGLQDVCLGRGFCGVQVTLAAWVLLGNLWLVARAAAA